MEDKKYFLGNGFMQRRKFSTVEEPLFLEAAFADSWQKYFQKRGTSVLQELLSF